MKLCLGLLALNALLLFPLTAESQVDSTRSVPIAPLTRMPIDAWGADVIVIDSAEIAASTAPTLSELLQARRPGVRVLRSGGTASDGALVMLRGPTSLTATNEPILIVDGVRVDSRQYDQPLGSFVTSVAPSRLDDLFPEDIERIVVLSGPAAALYGEGAANGVIIVTTKSGTGGPLRIAGRATYDAAITRDEFPANYRRTGVSPSTGQPVSRCLLVDVANGQCTPTGLDVWNPLEQASPFRIGNSGRGHLELGGTPLGTALFVGVTGEQREGTLPHDDRSRVGIRGKVSRALPWGFGIEATGAWLRDDARLAVDGNSALTSNVLANGLGGSAENDANHGYALGFAFSNDSIYPVNALRHASGGLTLSWQPLAWLGARVMTARDRVAERWHEEQLGPSLTTAFPDTRAFEENELRSSGGEVSATYHLRSRIAGMTAVTLERLVRRWDVYDTSTSPNSPALFGFSRLALRSASLNVTEHVGFDERLFITVAADRATNNIFGLDAGREWFPSGNLTWATPLRLRGVGDLRLRAAYAESPGAVLSPNLPPGVLPFASSSTPFMMERTKSLEVGADVTLGGATRVNLTAFDSRSTHLWETSLVSGGLGYGIAGQNAEMRNTGLEALVSAPLLDGGDLRWHATLSVTLLRNRVTGQMASSVDGVNGPYGRGDSFGGIWAEPYTYTDANGDGIIAPNELTFQPFGYIASSMPSMESALSTDLQLRGGVTVSGTFDYREGNRLIDRTGALRCELSENCRAVQDPSTSLADQAAAIVGLNGTGFVEDGAFLRVREIAVHWAIPSRWSGVVGTRAVLTLAGRNVATWTRYRGLDPEISYQPPGILPREDYMVMPLPRELIVRFDVGARALR